MNAKMPFEYTRRHTLKDFVYDKSKEILQNYGNLLRFKPKFKKKNQR